MHNFLLLTTKEKERISSLDAENYALIIETHWVGSVVVIEMLIL